MKTSLILMAQYDGRAVVPLWEICRDCFTHLTPDGFVAKADAGEIQIPIVRMDDSKRSPRGVHLADLATCIEKQTRLARRQCRKLTGVTYGGVRP